MKKLHTDHYFHIGRTHLTSGKPCQDYAISKVCQGAAIGVISDGCSSGRYTDVGSRILCLSTISAICNHWTRYKNATDGNISEIIKVSQELLASNTRHQLGLKLDDMLATCVYAYISPNNGGFVHIQGDGVVATKFKNGSIVTSRFDWNKNTPYYPAYREKALDRIPQFIQIHGNDMDAIGLHQKIWLLSPNKTESFDEEDYSIKQGIDGVTVFIPYSNEIDSIAIFSDGVTQIDGVDWKDAVLTFMAFKNTAGEFAKRRMIRGIRDFEKTGKGPIDDISYAVIHIEDDESE